MTAAPPERGYRLQRALAFAASVHHEQKRDGLWLAQHPFVRAVRGGSAAPDDLASWVHQVYCVTATYGEVLRSMSPPPPVGVWMDPWRDMEQLVELAGALGGGIPETGPRAAPATRAVQIWLRQTLSDRSQHIAAQVCWALAAAMNPEAWAYLAEGAARHFGLTATQLQFFRMGSRRRADTYAANLLTRIPADRWSAILQHTLLISRLIARVYDSARERC